MLKYDTAYVVWGFAFLNKTRMEMIVMLARPSQLHSVSEKHCRFIFMVFICSDNCASVHG